ncbi:MAG TPA: helix-turn-helix transcriptional regulator [Candidatus Dojkabacteria bacterium]|nr:helix-turn-helix transcriptional regulator [Candidatus Dojkabacteria bacterium]
MTFGKQLLLERKKNKLSAEKLAKACGVSRSYITLIENEQRLPSKDVMPKIAKALNIETEVVINWYLDGLRVKLERVLLNKDNDSDVPENIPELS